MTVFYGELGDTFYFGAAVNDTSGSAVDGTTPLYDVRLAGEAASAAPVLSGTPSLLSHANYGPGLYEISVAATDGNGFATGNTYHVFMTVTADSQTPGAYVGSIVLGQLQTAADLGLLIETTVATLASQTSFTLTAGSSVNDTYNEYIMLVEDADAADTREIVWASDYVGSSRTVSLDTATATFTLAVGDKVRVFAQLHPLSTSVLAAINAQADTALSDAAPVDANLTQVLGTAITTDGSAPGGGPIGY